MGSFDSINPLPPVPRIRPRTLPVPHKKPREKRPDSRSRRRPDKDSEKRDDNRPHIDEYA